MSTTLSQLTTLINDRRRDTTALSLDMTEDGFRAINGTLQLWNQFHDWPWQMETIVFNYNHGITKYNILSATTLDFKAVINVHPYKPNSQRDELYYVGQNKFDSDSIHVKKFAIDISAQDPLLRCQYIGFNLAINTCTSPTANGTWVGAGAISALNTDSYNSFEQCSSISFSYTGTSGTLTNSTFTPIDLTRYSARSVIFINLNLQSVTNFGSVTLNLGTDASDYLTVTATTDYLGNAPIVGWNRFAFPWSGTTTITGTLNVASIGYAQITFGYGSTSTTVMNDVENLWIAENVPMYLDYYSNNMVEDTSGNKYQIFQDAANTTDPAMWSGQWDFVNETLVDSIMERVSFITGEVNDEQIVSQNVQQYLEPLKSRLPSLRRYPQFTIVPDLNGEYYGPRPTPYRRYFQ